MNKRNSLPLLFNPFKICGPLNSTLIYVNIHRVKNTPYVNTRWKTATAQNSKKVVKLFVLIISLTHSLMCLFHFSTCFKKPSAHHQENQLYQYIIWYIWLYNFVLMFLYLYICFACLATQNFIFFWPCISVQFVLITNLTHSWVCLFSLLYVFRASRWCHW